MKICDLNTLYIDGGAGGVNTYLHEKARFLAGLDGAAEHILIVPSAVTGRRRLFGSTLYTIRSPGLPRNPHHRVLMNFRAIREILRREAPDVVEVDCTYLLGHPAARELAKRRPVVGFYHTHLPFHVGRLGPKAGSLVHRFLENLSWRYLAWCAAPLDRLLVPSTDIFRRLEARGFSRLEHVPLGVNLDLFRPAEAKTRSDRDLTVLYVGRLSGEKDLRVLFRAFEILAARRSGVRLLLAGDGALQGQAERFARGRRDVVLGGPRPYGAGIADLYAGADLVVLPGPSETFGLTILEALASGVPVVAMSRGGPLDLVTPEVGALARPGDAEDLAVKLGEVLERRPSAARCRRHVEGNFSWSRSFARLLDVYASAGMPRDMEPAPRPAADPVFQSDPVLGECSPVSQTPTGGIS